MILAQASGRPVDTLDLWLVGEAGCRQRLWQAAQTADLILIEGVMGLFDGQPSAADLAIHFGIPVLTVIDASAMAQTFAALAHGLATLRPELPFAGVLANRVAGASHARLLQDCLPPNLPWYGALSRDEGLSLPSRHLGLVPAAELDDLERHLDQAAQALKASMTAPLPAAIPIEPAPQPRVPPLLQGVRLGIARDAAFCFLYAANLELLQAMGADLQFFSPLKDQQLPDVDSLYLPGGYPELHLQTLADNQPMLAAIRAHQAAGKPLLAECGGLLYLAQELTDSHGQCAPLVGLLPGAAHMFPRLQALAMQQVTLPEGTLRGHSFHYSQLQTELPPLARGTCPRGRSTAEAVYRLQRLTASYIHFYFPSAPEVVAALLRP